MLLCFHPYTCSFVLTGIPTLDSTEHINIPTPTRFPGAATHAGEAVYQISVLDAECEGAVCALREAVRRQQRHPELLQGLLEHAVRGGSGPLGVPRGPVIQLGDLAADQKSCGRRKNDGLLKQRWTATEKSD